MVQNSLWIVDVKILIRKTTTTSCFILLQWLFVHMPNCPWESRVKTLSRKLLRDYWEQFVVCEQFVAWGSLPSVCKWVQQQPCKALWTKVLYKCSHLPFTSSIGNKNNACCLSEAKLEVVLHGFSAKPLRQEVTVLPTVNIGLFERQPAISFRQTTQTSIIA